LGALITRANRSQDQRNSNEADKSLDERRARAEITVAEGRQVRGPIERSGAIDNVDDERAKVSQAA